MPRAKNLNPEGTARQYGANVMLERGFAAAEPDAPMIWAVYRREDVSERDDTLDTYRWVEVARYKETEAGVCPDKAIERAEALAGKE